VHGGPDKTGNEVESYERLRRDQCLVTTLSCRVVRTYSSAVKPELSTTASKVRADSPALLMLLTGRCIEHYHQCTTRCAEVGSFSVFKWCWAEKMNSAAARSGSYHNEVVAEHPVLGYDLLLSILRSLRDGGIGSRTGRSESSTGTELLPAVQ
jgi:hypothetical protein